MILFYALKDCQHIKLGVHAECPERDAPKADEHLVWCGAAVSVADINADFEVLPGGAVPSVRRCRWLDTHSHKRE